MKRVLRYLIGTKDAVIEMLKPIGTEKGKVHLRGYSDADWADDSSSRRSKTSGHIRADGCPLFGFIRKQGATATSSAVAGFYAATGVAEELLMFKEIITFLGYEVDAELMLDANAAKGIALRLGCGRIKHLEVRSLWLQEAVSRRLLRVGRKLEVARLMVQVMEGTLSMTCSVARTVEWLGTPSDLTAVVVRA